MLGDTNLWESPRCFPTHRAKAKHLPVKEFVVSRVCPHSWPFQVSSFCLLAVVTRSPAIRAAMEVQDDEAYHSGQYLQTEQLESNDSKKHALSAEQSGPGPHLGTKREESSSMSKVFGKEGSYKGLGMQEASETSRRKAKVVTPLGVNADTPTTSLVKGLAAFNLKRNPYQQSTVDSPLSDYGSGNFPSISDAGYASMPSIDKNVDRNEPSSDVMKKPSTTVEHSTVDRGATRITKGSESESMDIDVVGTPTEDKVDIVPKSATVPIAVTVVPVQQHQKRVESNTIDIQKAGSVMTGETKERQQERLIASPTKYRKSKSPSPSPVPSSLSTSPSHVRSESPKSIPSVGENIEIITDSGVGVAMEEEISSRPEGPSMKRSASSATDSMAEYYGRSSKKTPRLDDDSSRNSIAGKTKKMRERVICGCVTTNNVHFVNTNY